jgi:dolichol-phosphate mannosyltransferase
MAKVSVVVPTFNESKNILNLVTQVNDALKNVDYEIIFVDDSKDNTPDVIRDVAKDFPQVRLEHREGESGLATAVLKGFELAEGDYLACMDADLQHPPIVLKYMYKAMEAGADFCIPSRLIPGGDDGGLNWYRKFVSWTARKMGQIALPCIRQISDPTSGLFMFRKECIKDADLQPIGWKIMIEVLAMGSYKKVIEIPYKFQQRTEGESKLSKKVTMEYIEQLKNLKKRYNKENHYTVEKWSMARMMQD